MGAINELVKMQVYGIDKCPKCGSTRTERYAGWRSLTSGTIYCFEIRCLDCMHEWSW